MRAMRSVSPAVTRVIKPARSCDQRKQLTRLLVGVSGLLLGDLVARRVIADEEAQGDGEHDEDGDSNNPGKPGRHDETGTDQGKQRKGAAEWPARKPIGPPCPAR